MSISALSGTTTGTTIASLPPAATSSAFGAQLSVAVGQGRTGHGHRTQEAGTPDSATSAPGAVSTPAAAVAVHSTADDTRALVGDVFGALGADTPTMAAAQRAIAAYRQAG